MTTQDAPLPATVLQREAVVYDDAATSTTLAACSSRSSVDLPARAAQWQRFEIKSPAKAPSTVCMMPPLDR